MNMFFDWWFATSPRLRQLCWAFWLLILVTLIFLSSTHHEERDALIRLRASHHQQWAALYRLVDTTPFSEDRLGRICLELMTFMFRLWIFSYPARNWFPGIHPRREVSWR